MYTRQMERARLRLLLAGVVVFGVLLTAGAAAAISVGPCDGSVKIDGTTYTPENDSPANPIVIPDKEGLVAEWAGSTDGVIKNHTGDVGVVVGPGTINLATWDGENANDEVESKGDYNVDDARDLLPFDVVGLYELRAAHSGDGGSCSATAMILIEGNPLSTPAGQAAAAGAGISFVGLVLAGRGGKA